EVWEPVLERCRDRDAASGVAGGQFDFAGRARAQDPAADLASVFEEQRQPSVREPHGLDPLGSISATENSAVALDLERKFLGLGPGIGFAPENQRRASHP